MVERLLRPDESESGASHPDTIAEISEWIRSTIPTALTELLSETLEYLCSLFEAPRALVVWDEADEPWVNLACSEEGSDRLLLKQVAPSTFEPLVADRFDGLSFWYDGQKSPQDSTAPIHPVLCRDYSILSALSIPMRSEEVSGRIFILGIDRPGPHHFALGEIVSAIVESRLRFATARDREQTFEVEDRIRMIARDLHDGLLQSFTGIVLHLESLIPLISSDPEVARSKVTEIEGVLMSEQRELRSYLESLREKRKAAEVDFDMTARLRALADQYQDQWGVEVEYRRDSLDPVVRKALGWETYRIITEAITNAIRHGQAKHIRVMLSTRGDHLRIGVKDDGEGFAFRGTRSGPQLLEQGMAPSSLTERIHSLNGTISIESTDQGSHLDILIPIGWKH